MDLIMPNMDGIEATNMIRKEFPAPKNEIKIIALTASVIQSEIDKSKAAGMNGFIPKPFKPNELYGTIYNALNNDSDYVIEEKVLVKNFQKAKVSAIDLKYLLEFTDGDEIRMKRYIDLFMTKTPANISLLKLACVENDFEKIRITAHSMKPQLRFTGVMQGLELAEKIEQNCFEKINLNEVAALIDELSLITDKALAEMNNYKVV
jgi:CheY-like chemotaxis protein